MPALARGPSTTITAQGQAPRTPRPIELHVEVEDLGLEELLKRLGLDIAIEGVTEAKVKLSGSPDDPGINLRVRLNQLVAPGLASLDVTITARSEPGGPITLGFTTEGIGGPAESGHRATSLVPWEGSSGSG